MYSTSQFINFLEEELYKKKMTKIEFLNKVGISKNSFFLWKNRNTLPRREILERICNVLDVSIYELMGDAPKAVGHSDSFQQIYKIPLFECASAGFGTYADEHIADYIPVVARSQDEAANMLAIRVKGNSMSPKIEDGDTIIVRKQSSVDSGDIAVMMIGDEAFVKKIQYGMNYVDLISLNKDYPVKHFQGQEILNIKVMGKVLSVQKTL